jgi:hypothetical protein
MERGVESNLLLLPFTWNPASFGLWCSGKWHDLLFTLPSKPFNCRLIGIVAGVWVLERLQPANNVQLLSR